MFKYRSVYRVCMTVQRINMSFHKSVLKRLDKLRGTIPRSTFLSYMIMEHSK